MRWRLWSSAHRLRRRVRGCELHDELRATRRRVLRRDGPTVRFNDATADVEAKTGADGTPTATADELVEGSLQVFCGQARSTVDNADVDAGILLLQRHRDGTV